MSLPAPSLAWPVWTALCGVALLMAVAALVDFTGRRDAGPLAHAREDAHILCNTLRGAVIVSCANGDCREPCPTIAQLKASHILASDFPSNDDWGNAFDSHCQNHEPVCRLAGPDGKMGTEDDVVIPQPLP